MPLPDSKPICNAIDVVEPAGYQIDLQDTPIIETDGAQPSQVFRHHSPRMMRQFRGVVEHCPVLFVKIGLRVVPPQRGSEFLVQRDALEKLGMALDSVGTAVQCAD